MRRIVCLILCVIFCFALAACQSTDENAPESELSSDVTSVLNREIATEALTTQSSEPTSQISSAEITAETDERQIDIDLTPLSGAMVYAELYNIFGEADKNVGKVIKMTGQFDMYEDTSTGERSYGCVVTDVGACCVQGLEFLPREDYCYPQDFPQVNSEITVTGTFETFVENGIAYCRLTDATMEF